LAGKPQAATSRTEVVCKQEPRTLQSNSESILLPGAEAESGCIKLSLPGFGGGKIRFLTGSGSDFGFFSLFLAGFFGISALPLN
jgi:hypothetical protein